MIMHNFSIINVDTDAIMFCKPDQSPFSEEEINDYLKEVNDLFPEKIRIELDFTCKSVVVVKAKNYAMLMPDGKIKIKGSGLRPAGKEKAFKDFMSTIIEMLLHDRAGEIPQIYESCAKKLMDIKDITPFVSKHTISEKVLKPTRTNEQKVLDACQGIDVQQGDKIYLYFRPDGSLARLDQFDGNYDKDVLLKKLFQTAKIFNAVIDLSLLPNFALKKNKAKLQELLDKPK